MTTVNMTTGSCSTLLCLRLCSSAWGTPSHKQDRKNDEPKTRETKNSDERKNISTGIASPDILANNSILPRFHVLSSVNAAEAITSGNQPPREILDTLVSKKALSMSKKAPASGMTSQMLQRQSRTIASVSSTESISMVPVTATP